MIYECEEIYPKKKPPRYCEEDEIEEGKAFTKNIFADKTGYLNLSQFFGTVNAAAEVLVTIAHCNKADALKAVFNFYSQILEVNFDEFVKVVPDYIVEDDDTDEDTEDE